MIYSLEIFSTSPSGKPGLTFVVTNSNTIIYTQTITRHRDVTIGSGRLSHEIAWGGILDTSGNWVRASIDYGDAPDKETRDKVLSLIREDLAKH